MLKKKSKKVGICGRFIAIFMTAVLLVTVMPIEAKASNLYYRIELKTVTDPNIVEIYKDYFYFVDVTNNNIYYFEKVDNNIVVKNIPSNIDYRIYSIDGRFHTNGHISDLSVHYDARIATINFYDGTVLLDTIYLLGYAILNEEYSYKPMKEGYVFTGWVDKDGKELSFPMQVGGREVVEHGGTSNVYATWELHEHQWNVDEWNNDDSAHWHECMVDNCPITENSEKDGYAIHEMGEWEIVTEPKFKEDGLKKRNCQICAYEEEEIISKLSDSHVHEFEGREEVILEPKCYEPGLKYVYCTLEECGAYEERQIEKILHDYEEDWRYNDKIHYHKCENCEDCTDETNHKMTEWTTVVEPEFNKDGLKERHCEECEYEETEIIQKLSDTHIHDYKGPEEIINDSTCTEEGLKKVHCYEEQCEAYIEKSIPKKEHKFDVGWKYDEDMHYHQCIYCEAHGEDDGYHDMIETGMVKLATKDSPGIMELECIKCRYIDYEEVPCVEESKEEINPEIKDQQQGVIKDDLPPFSAPQTGEMKIVHIYATLAMIGGMTYLLLYFKPLDVTMSEETKKKLVDKLIKWAKSRNKFVKAIALLGISVVLFYYHFMTHFIKREEKPTERAEIQ